MLNNILFLNFHQLLVDLLLQCHALFLAHLFLDFGYIFFSSCVTLLCVLSQFVVVDPFDVLNESSAISNAGSFESVDDGAASFIETVRSTYLYWK